MAVVILAFAHVTDIDASSLLPVNQTIELIPRSKIWHQVRCSGVGEMIRVKTRTWFEDILLLMSGHKKDYDYKYETETDLNICPSSNYGWSVYVKTFGEADPAYLIEWHILHLTDMTEYVQAQHM